MLVFQNKNLLLLVYIKQYAKPRLGSLSSITVVHQNSGQRTNMRLENLQAEQQKKTEESVHTQSQK